jgi:hypothetical protein
MSPTSLRTEIRDTLALAKMILVVSEIEQYVGHEAKIGAVALET